MLRSSEGRALLAAGFVVALAALSVPTALADDPVEAAVVGTWANVTPDPKDPNIKWNQKFTVGADGKSRLLLSVAGKTLPGIDGTFEARDGTWKWMTAKGSDGGPYRLVDGALELTYKSGKKLTWTRVGAPPAPAASPAPGASTAPPEPAAPSPAPALSGTVDPALAGIWKLRLHDQELILDVALEGNYVLTLEGGDKPHAPEQGRIEGSDGKWRLLSQAGRQDSGTYELVGKDEMKFTGATGVALTWHRVAQAVPLIDTRPAEERLLAASPASAQAQAPPGLMDLLAGAEALEAANYTDALAAFDKAVAASDENGLYHQARGATYVFLSRSDDAKNELDRAQRLRSDRVNACFLYVALKEGPNPQQVVWNRVPGLNDLRPDREGWDQLIERAAELAGRSHSNKVPSRGHEETKSPIEEFHAACAKLAQAYAHRLRVSGGADVARVQFAHAKERLEKGDVDGAVKDLVSVLAAYPEDPLVAYLAARIAIAQGDDDLARIVLTRVLTVATDFGPAYALRATVEARIGAQARARADLARATALSPRDADAVRSQVEKALAATSGPTDVAPLVSALYAAADAKETTFEQVAEAAVSLSRAMNATRRRLDESYQEELGKLEDGVRAEPRSPDRLAALGNFLFDAATGPSYEQVDAAGPGRSFRYLTRHSQAQERQRAERCADLALSVNPKNVRAITVKARCRTFDLQYADAGALVRRGLAIAPRDPELLEALAEVLDATAARLEGESAALSTPKTGSDVGTGRDASGVWFTTFTTWTQYPSPAELAQAAELSKQAAGVVAQARQLVEDMLKSRPDTPEACWLVGNVCQGRDDLEHARQYFEEAVRLRPNWRKPHVSLARLLGKRGDAQAAVAELSLAINLTETTAAVFLKLGGAQIARTAWTQAFDALRNAKEVDPADARVWAYAAIVEHGMGREPQTHTHYRMALALEEALVRSRGKAPLDPEMFGLGLAIRLRLANAIRSPGAPNVRVPADEAARILAPIVERLEPRLPHVDIVPDVYYPHSCSVPRAANQRIYSAQLPDRTRDAKSEAEVPTLMELLQRARMGYALALEELGRGDDVLRVLKDFPHVVPKDDAAGAALYICAQVSWKKGDKAGARRFFQDAETLHGNGPLSEHERKACFALDPKRDPRKLPFEGR